MFEERRWPYENSYDGSISGSGSVTIRGATAFTGQHSYRGGTYLEAELKSTTDSIQGDLHFQHTGTLSLKQDFDGLFLSRMDGEGHFFKDGSGIVIFGSDSRDFQGRTFVHDSELRLQRIFDDEAYLGGDVEVRSGARRGGAGIIGGDLSVAGTLAPDADAPVYVEGTLSMTYDSVLEVSTNALGEYSRVIVTGEAFAGWHESTLRLASSPSWSLLMNTPLTLLNAYRLHGEFGQIESDLAFLQPTLDYSASDVTMTLTRNNTPFAAVGITRNQRETAAAVDSMSTSSPVYSGVVGLDPDSARSTSDLLSGEIYASNRSALIDDSRFLRNGITRRLNGNAVASALDGTGIALWLDADGQQSRGDATRDTAESRVHGHGAQLGADIGLGTTARLGLVIGANEMNQRVDDRGLARTEVDGKHIGLYAAGKWGPWGLRGTATYSDYDVDSKREVHIPNTIQDPLRSSYDAKATAASIEGSYRFDFAKTALEPYVNVTYTRLKTDAFSEHGGASALRSDSQTDNVTSATLGLRARWDISAGQVDNAAIVAAIGWEHTWGDWESESRMQFSDGTAFTVLGAPLAENATVMNLGIDLSPSQTSRINLGLDGRIGDDDKAYGAHINWKVGF